MGFAVSSLSILIFLCFGATESDTGHWWFKLSTLRAISLEVYFEHLTCSLQIRCRFPVVSRQRSGHFCAFFFFFVWKLDWAGAAGQRDLACSTSSQNVSTDRGYCRNTSAQTQQAGIRTSLLCVGDKGRDTKYGVGFGILYLLVIIAGHRITVQPSFAPNTDSSIASSWPLLLDI